MGLYDDRFPIVVRCDLTTPHTEHRHTMSASKPVAELVWKEGE